MKSVDLKICDNVTNADVTINLTFNNIFKEIDILEEQYGGICLNGKELVLYEHNKKNPVAAFVYLASGFGLQRFYIGDRLSKIFAFYFLFFCIVFLWGKFAGLHIISNIGFYALTPFIILDLFLIVPLIRLRNLILKKNIIENIDSVKDRGSYRWQEYLAPLALFFSILLYIAAYNS